MPLSRDFTDQLLSDDAELDGVDGERFRLDLSEIADDARKITQLIEAAGGAPASELLTGLAGSVAHLTSHWQSLARLTD